MAINPIRRDQGDTGPGLSAQLLINGSPMNLVGASVVAVVAGTIGSGAAATYQRFVLAATWTVASAGDASVAVGLNPSGLAPGGAWPCASPGFYFAEFRGVDANGLETQWPPLAAIPFIVRTQL